MQFCRFRILLLFLLCKALLDHWELALYKYCILLYYYYYHHHEYWFSDKPLSAVDHRKHLGFWLESSLSWDYHMNYICAKANKVPGLIRRNFGPNNSEGVSTAYKTLVRPILEHVCQVWNPYLVEHIKSIELIQRRATRVICGSKKEYQERLGVRKWPSLELRRKLLSADVQDYFRTL